MKSLPPLALLAVLVSIGASGCQSTSTQTSRPSLPSGSPDDRPYNLQKSQFEDPAPPKHRTSPGDAAR